VIRRAWLGFALGSFALAGACASPNGEPLAPDPDAPVDYVFVFLKTKLPQPELTPDQTKEVFEGHFANMGRLAEQGWLLVAGPFGSPQTDPMNRGVFVFDVPTPELALELAESDPAVRAGIFRLEAHPWRAQARLRDFPALEADAMQAAKESGKPDAFDVRGYVLAFSAEGESAERALERVHDGRILLSGRFGEEREELLAIVDAESVDAARDVLPEGVEWTLHPWAASRNLARLRKADVETAAAAPRAKAQVSPR
jgi:uncharacterized protein YciI